MKYVLVTGGVVSGLGKGVTASSIGLILKACGLRVTSIKIGLSLSPSSSSSYSKITMIIMLLTLYLCVNELLLVKLSQLHTLQVGESLSVGEIILCC